MKQLGAAKSKLERLKAKGLERPQIEEKGIKVDFGEENTQSRIALQIKDFSLRYGDNILFDGAEMEIHSREKVALVGPNGSGKSSLLGALMREGDWDGETLRIGPSQIIGYLSQVPSFTEGAVTIREEVRSWGPISQEEAFKLVAPFSFAFEDMDKNLEVLSGGETNRLQLARLMYKKTNFLILDEPTNHMDIASREIIEEAVSQFAGTVFVVSHDRYFLDKLVDRVVEIREGRLFSFEGNFSEYFRNRYPVLPRLSGNIDTRGRERKESSGSSGPTGGIPLEIRIQECEDEKGNWEKELKRALAANDQKEGRRAAVKLEQLNARLEKFYREWEEQEN